MAIIGQGVSLDGMTHNDFHYPFLLAASVTIADVGKPMALDAAANTMKVAGDGEEILGKLVTFEDRQIEGIKVGTVTLRGGFSFPIASGETVNVGDTLVGGVGGVKAAAVADHSKNFVVEVADGAATIVR